MKNRLHRPPSRIRYEESHPTVSVRVSRELYERLQSLKALSGKSVGDILREAVGAQEATANQADERGYRRGYRDAEARFRVDYHCVVCGGTVVLHTENAKRAAAQYMQQNKWRHTKCREQDR